MAKKKRSWQVAIGDICSQKECHWQLWQQIHQQNLELSMEQNAHLLDFIHSHNFVKARESLAVETCRKKGRSFRVVDPDCTFPDVMFVHMPGLKTTDSRDCQSTSSQSFQWRRRFMWQHMMQEMCQWEWNNSLWCLDFFHWLVTKHKVKQWIPLWFTCQMTPLNVQEFLAVGCMSNFHVRRSWMIYFWCLH